MKKNRKIRKYLSSLSSASDSLAQSQSSTIKQTADSTSKNEPVAFEIGAHVEGKIDKSQAEIGADVHAKASMPLVFLRGLILMLPNFLKKKDSGE